MALTSPRFAGNARLQAAARNSPAMRYGERGEAVTLVQDALVDLGFPMPVSTKNGTQAGDGIYGQETTRTVRRFQADHGLQTDGIAGRNTLHTLDAHFADHTLPAAFERAYVRMSFSCTTLRDKGGSGV